ncbi:MAG: methyltransferase [Acidobacteriia bacterium]|nr:methyltransferase [Terriglobia bacterium]
MDSRERVLTALRHQEPDRVPIDFSGHRSSGISAIAYARLREYLGLAKLPIRVYDPVQQLAIVDEDVLRCFQVDTIELGRAFALEDEWWTDWELPDGTPCQMPVWAKPEKENGGWAIKSRSRRTIARMPEGVLYFEQAHYPLAEGGDLSRLDDAFHESMWTAIAAPPGPIAAGPEGIRRLAQGAKRLRSQTERAILGLFGGNLLEIGQFFYGNDNFFLMLAGNPGRAHEFLDRLVEIHLQNLERFLGAVGTSVDIIVFGDDLGMQSGPQISPKMYWEFFQPRECILWRRAKEIAPHIKVKLHCCGGVRQLLPGLIEAGLDAINPVQISCRGMDPAELKREFGNRLTFWGGGCDTQNVLLRGTPAQVRDHVRRLMDIWRPGGGYVFQQVHNILAHVPPENIVAMFDTVKEA